MCRLLTVLAEGAGVAHMTFAEGAHVAHLTAAMATARLSTGRRHRCCCCFCCCCCGSDIGKAALYIVDGTEVTEVTG